MQTMGQFKATIEMMNPNKINTVTENFIKNKHGIHIIDKMGSETEQIFQENRNIRDNNHSNLNSNKVNNHQNNQLISQRASGNRRGR